MAEVAYTPPNFPYPPYFNARHSDSGGVQVTVRSPAFEGTCGACAQIDIPREEFRRLLEEMNHELG